LKAEKLVKIGYFSNFFIESNFSTSFIVDIKMTHTDDDNDNDDDVPSKVIYEEL
jgi:hypothetical protein